ncbi:MAG: accessory factor UbiK family protein [Proteobacteria bacterium]|nr:accessory factor UbiK family protein [Pseudomonadota bacterium]
MRSGAKNLRFLEDMAKVASGAMQSMGDLRGQVKSMVQAFLAELDVVSREEFDRVEALAQKARERQVELEKRLIALEKKLQATARRKKK